MNWRKVGAVLKREYVEHIRRKTFWIFTILMPVIWVVFIGISIFTQTHLTGTKKIAVVDESGRYFSPLAQAVAASKHADKVKLMDRQIGPGGLPALEAELKKEIDGKTLDGYLILSPESIATGKIPYRAASDSDLAFQEMLSTDLNNALLSLRLASRGLSVADIAQIEKRVEIDAARVDNKNSGGLAASFIFMMFLYITLIQYGYYNLRGVIEEKSNRIVEVVISSVRPTELMLGKIVGIGLVGLTQYLIWSVLAMNLALFSSAGVAGLLPGSHAIPQIPLSTVVYFVLYFLLGYFLYASIYTALGAPFNTDQEAQQLSMIPTFLIVSIWAFWGAIMNAPNSTLSTVLSFIPFLTPLVMFFRVTLAPVPAWQIALSIVEMVAAIVAMAWFAGKIYRVGILMYGKKPTVPEILRWVRGSGERAAAAEPASPPSS